MKKTTDINLQNYITNRFGDIGHKCTCGERWMKSFKGSISFIEDDKRNKSLISFVENCECFKRKKQKISDDLLKEYLPFVSFDFESILCAIRDRKSVLNELINIKKIIKPNKKQIKHIQQFQNIKHLKIIMKHLIQQSKRRLN